MYVWLGWLFKAQWPKKQSRFQHGSPANPSPLLKRMYLLMSLIRKKKDFYPLEIGFLRQKAKERNAMCGYPVSRFTASKLCPLLFSLVSICILSVIGGDQSGVSGVTDFNSVIFGQEFLLFEVLWNWRYFTYCTVENFYMAARRSIKPRSRIGCFTYRTRPPQKLHKR